MEFELLGFPIANANLLASASTGELLYRMTYLSKA